MARIAMLLPFALAACQTTPPPAADTAAPPAAETLVIAPPPPAETAAPKAAPPRAIIPSPASPKVAIPEAAPSKAAIPRAVIPGASIPGAATPTPLARPTPAEDNVAKAEPVAPATPPAPPAPPPIDDNPEQVMGLDHGALRALLGAPGFTRREASAQVWQYRSRACVLDLFLYGEKDGRYRVTYYEFRGDRLDRADERRCFRALLGAADPG